MHSTLFSPSPLVRLGNICQRERTGGRKASTGQNQPETVAVAAQRFQNLPFRALLFGSVYPHESWPKVTMSRNHIKCRKTKTLDLRITGLPPHVTSLVTMSQPFRLSGAEHRRVFYCVNRLIPFANLLGLRLSSFVVVLGGFFVVFFNISIGDFLNVMIPEMSRGIRQSCCLTFTLASF